MEMNTAIICPPDLSLRLFKCKAEKFIALPVNKLFKAWTTEFPLWFASPGSMLSRFEINTPFFFETSYEGTRHPHYGRYLRIEENALIQFTWITGKNGTNGEETVVTVELDWQESGTQLRLTHAGFADKESKNRHAEAWPLILNQLEERMSRPID